MSRVTDAPPLQLLVGPPGHGVTAYAADVAAALHDLDDRTRVISVAGVSEAIVALDAVTQAHLHVTDRLLGGSPEEAAENLERLADRTALTITVHDVPQASDGRMLARRIAAYTRFFAAARAVTVNSRHEQRLIGEFLPDAIAPHAIPLGARVGRVPDRPAPAGAAGGENRESLDPRELRVLIAGYVYPGKGHAQAIAAAAEASALLAAGGEQTGAIIVRAIGGPSAGHERDIDALRIDAERRGVRFEVTGFLEDDTFASEIVGDGIPLAAHEHVSASRSMLDWVEAGRHPLVVSSRYAHEMAVLRPRTLAIYEPDELAHRLAEAWRRPDETWLAPGFSLTPSLSDVAEQYRSWWAGLVTG